MTPSPLGLYYRYNAQAECLEARYDHDEPWRASVVPGLHLMFATVGEVECALRARDRALDEREDEE